MRPAEFGWKGTPLQAVLFDLDGTLIDTAADIALALNRAFGEQGLPAVDAGTVRGLIGRGAALLITRALAQLGRSAGEVELERIYDRFLHHYALLQEQGESLAEAYPGARAALQALESGGVQLAVVTNKVHRLAISALAHAGLESGLGVVVGGDTCARRKPDGEPLLYACRTLGVAPQRALMVGDSVNDVQAARAAGMPVLCVPYGYNEGEDPRLLPCDGFIESLADLPDLLRR